MQGVYNVRARHLKIGSLCLCVCVYVCERESTGGGEGERPKRGYSHSGQTLVSWF